MILSHVNCFIQGEIQWFQALLDSLHPRSTGTSRWSPPLLQGEAVKICLAQRAENLAGCSTPPTSPSPLNSHPKPHTFWPWHFYRQIVQCGKSLHSGNQLTVDDKWVTSYITDLSVLYACVYSHWNTTAALLKHRYPMNTESIRHLRLDSRIAE